MPSPIAATAAAETALVTLGQLQEAIGMTGRQLIFVVVGAAIGAIVAVVIAELMGLNNSATVGGGVGGGIAGAIAGIAAGQRKM